MSCYLIKIEYTHSERGSKELNKVHYPYANCEPISDIIQDTIEGLFKARYDRDDDDNGRGWIDGKARFVYRAFDFSDELVAKFKADMAETFGARIWDEMQPFTVTGELKPDLYVDPNQPELTGLEFMGLKYEPSETEISEFWKLHGKDTPISPPWKIDWFADCVEASNANCVLPNDVLPWDADPPNDIAPWDREANELVSNNA